MIIFKKQKEFGAVKAANKAKKRAWENRMAGIDNPDNPFGYDRFVSEDFDYDKFDDSRNSAKLRKMDHKIRQNSGDRKILNPEYAENIEKKTRFREENSIINPLTIQNVEERVIPSDVFWDEMKHLRITFFDKESDFFWDFNLISPDDNIEVDFSGD